MRQVNVLAARAAGHNQGSIEKVADFLKTDVSVVWYDAVCAGLAQLFASAIRGNAQALHSGGLRRLHSRDCVFYYERIRRVEPQVFRRTQEDCRVGLAFFDVITRHDGLKPLQDSKVLQN